MSYDYGNWRQRLTQTTREGSPVDMPTGLSMIVTLVMV